MKLFCYFVEPAAYTLDLVKNIHDPLSIDYCFISSKTLVRSAVKSKKKFLDKLSFIERLSFLFSVYKNNDLIIVNGYNNYPFIITFIFNIFLFRKTYIAIESDSQLSIPNSRLKRFLKWLYLFVVFSSKYVLGFAGGSSSHKELFRYYGMQDDRIFLMPMMVDNFKFYQNKKKFPELFTFLYVGRLVKHKNVEGLIKEFNKNFSDKSVVLKIVGGGEEERYLKKKYHSEQVVFLGSLFDNDLIKEFQNASCFVCPSKFEPWGLVINEALSSGLPVVTTKEVGANYDLIKERNTGIIAASMHEFGAMMLEFYGNINLLIECSENASDLMKNYWNYDLYNKCLQDAIKQVDLWD